MIAARPGARLALAACLALGADLATKAIAEVTLPLSDPQPVIGQVLRLTLVHNTGTAFGLFPGQRMLFLLFSLVAMVAVLILFRRLHAPSAAQTLAMGLLLGGAAGNVHDRVRFGEVTDFIQVGVAGHYWPVFNVADAAITAGVVLLALTLVGRGTPAVPGDLEPEG